MAVHPADDASFELFLPAGNFQLSAAAPGYITQTTDSFATGINNPIVTQDFYLGYLSPALNPAFSFNESNLSITWQAPMEPEFELLGYNIYKRVHADKFELCAQTTETVYTELISEIGSYQYYIRAYYDEGESVPTEILAFDYPYTDLNPENQTPLVNMLYHNYPNPFNPTTTIAYSTKTPGVVMIQVYNLKGQLVKKLINEHVPAGKHSVVWDGKDMNNRSVASGIYLYRLETKDYSHTRKAMLMK
jgi:hypothetical protein